MARLSFKWVPPDVQTPEQQARWTAWMNYLRIADFALAEFEEGLDAMRVNFERELVVQERRTREAVLAWIARSTWTRTGFLNAPAAYDQMLNNLAASWMLFERKLIAHGRNAGPTSVGRSLQLADDALHTFLTKRFSPPNPLTEAAGLDPDNITAVDIAGLKGSTEHLRADFQWNIRGIIFNALRHVRELVYRIAGGGMQKSQAQAAAREFSVNRNTWRLSTEAHPRASLRRMLFAVADRAGAKTVLVHSIRGVRAAGATGRLLWRVFARGPLQKVYRKYSTTANPEGLGLHPNSTEMPVPVPAGLEEEAKGWAGRLRKSFLGRGYNWIKGKWGVKQ